MEFRRNRFQDIANPKNTKIKNFGMQWPTHPKWQDAGTWWLKHFGLYSWRQSWQYSIGWFIFWPSGLLSILHAHLTKFLITGHQCQWYWKQKINTTLWMRQLYLVSSKHNLKTKSLGFVEAKHTPFVFPQIRDGEEFPFSLHLKLGLSNLHFANQHENQNTAIIWNPCISEICCAVLQPTNIYIF